MIINFDGPVKGLRAITPAEAGGIKNELDLMVLSVSIRIYLCPKCPSLRTWRLCVRSSTLVEAVSNLMQAVIRQAEAGLLRPFAPHEDPGAAQGLALPRQRLRGKLGTSGTFRRTALTNSYGLFFHRLLESLFSLACLFIGDPLAFNCPGLSFLGAGNRFIGL